MEFTSELMNLRLQDPILKYGNFEMVSYNENYVIFRRSLNNESLLCVVNRDLNTIDIKLNSNAENATVIYGNCSLNLDSGKLHVSDIAENFGLIIKES